MYYLEIVAWIWIISQFINAVIIFLDLYIYLPKKYSYKPDFTLYDLIQSIFMSLLLGPVASLCLIFGVICIVLEKSKEIVLIKRRGK